MPLPTPARLVGGPHGGNRGEVEGDPLTLAFGGFTYERVPDPDGLPNPAVLTYRYAPQLSPAHDLAMQAERDAIREVAEQEGVSVDVVIARARLRRQAAAEGDKPADLLFREAERLGCTVEQLLNEGFDVTTLGQTQEA